MHCTVLAGAGARYLILPQFSGAELPYGGYGFRIGDPAALPTATVVAEAASQTMGHDTGEASAQFRLDLRLRAMDAAAALVGGRAATIREPVPHLVSSVLASQRRFSVLSTLDVTPRWTAVDAVLRYEGVRIALYVDTLVAGLFSDADVTAMGALYDGVLAPRVLAAFGEGSDIDANGRILLLLTPVVNALMPAADCATRGYVRGFFFGHDLASGDSTSNRGEVFYAYVPDPTGRWSCAHSKSDVLANLAPTFMHELQHMLSFGEHVLKRGGPAEEPWLNEGLSHVSEELGATYWEGVFPAPTGRSDPTQILPDSASPYLTPNLLYSYRFLAASPAYSLTSCAPGSFCSQSERGGGWLFLRWIVDQHGPAVLRRLVGTDRVGIANLEAATGESAAVLLGDFAVAVSADSLEGVSRSAVPLRFQFRTRNLRALYRRLFQTVGLPGGVARPFPVAPVLIERGAARTGSMRLGSFATYSLGSASDQATIALRFAVPDGGRFPPSLGAQVMVFRIQ